MRRALLLMGVEYRRRVRMLNVRAMRLKPKETRTATAHKGRANWVIILVGVYMTVIFPVLSVQQLAGVDQVLRQAPHGVSWVETSLTVNVFLAACIVLLLRGMATVAIDLTSQDLQRSDWDLEWLVTMPIPRRTLLAVRVVQRALISQGSFLFVLPVVTAVAWMAGYRWTLPLVVLGTALPLALIQGCVVVLAETVLRMRLRPDRVRNLQAGLTTVGVLIFYMSFAPSLLQGSVALSVLKLARLHPEPLLLLPGSLVLTMVCSPGMAFTAGCLLWLQCTAACLLTLSVLERLLAGGVVSGGAWETGRSTRKAGGPRFEAAWLTPIQRKDLTLLSRDRNFLVQALVMPVLLAGAQLWFNPLALQAVITDPYRAAAVVFGLAAFVQLGSAYQVIVREGQALWLLYSSPVSLESILWQKASFWAVISTLYAMVAFVVIHLSGLSFRLDSLFAMGFVLLGIPIYAVIATCLGVEGTDPWEEVPQRKLRSEYIYLYMMLASIYAVALLMSDWLQRSVLLMLTMFMAFAMWQKMRDKLPYLLDPTASPRPSVSLSDGLISVQAFFILQALLSWFFLALRHDPVTTMVEAFAWAGAVVYLSNRYAFWRKKSQDVPTLFGPGLGPALGAGVVGGVVAALFGLFYLHLGATGPRPTVGVGLLVLGVVCAPLCEEFIFRGLVFNGLRRSFNPRVAVVASAVLFAALHPPLSMLPVFVMALCAASVYERHRQLVAPMLVHAIYNAFVLVLNSY